ncbi:MAG: PhoX family phosphatase [Synechococcaceae cyanobacterium SM2_3_1]|nr:PhoX family phosphatase [Synechococcaceae cyanobacterium SM2_3_1]
MASNQHRPFTAAELDDIGSNPSANRTFADVLATRFTRRAALQGISATVAASAFASLFTRHQSPAHAAAASSLTFSEIAHGYEESHRVAEGYRASVLIRWGDPVVPGTPGLDPMAQTAELQEKQFGYNNDMIAYFPLPVGSDNSENGILCINHEYTDTHLMFPGFNQEQGATQEQADIEIAAHGVSVVEVKKVNGEWQVVPDSQYNRTIRLSSTPIAVSGPAAGHDRLKTSADPTGLEVIGTINNCAGGWTPWGTYLTAEENFHQYFAGERDGAEYERYGIVGQPSYNWGQYHDRFDIAKEPNEPMRFGWVVEIDPYDPASKPVKRTSLGRFKHENATTVVAPNGQVVVYSGDDERFDYVYKFVTKGTYKPEDREANFNLLDEGTLYVAKFEDDGRLLWLPVVFGEGPLTAENGFNSQAEVVLETRRASDLLGATKMDRPEDVEANPVNGHVYVMLTNNNKRAADQVDAVNERAENIWGHIVEMIPPGEGANADHTATEFTWEVFIKAGDPSDAATGASYGEGVSANGWFCNPDNVAFDNQGRIWISTDGCTGFGFSDGIWAADTTGEAKAVSKHFFACPKGAEMCGPKFTPDGRTLFVAVQHPGDDDGSTFENPSTRWPDFQEGMPPRPSVVAITKEDGDVIGA